MDIDDAEAVAFGEILATMIRAGADAAVLGRFAAMYRNRFSTSGEPAGALEMGPVLESFAEAVAHKVLAQREVRAVADGPRGSTPAARGASGRKPPMKIVKLFLVNGQETSVSLPPSLLQRARDHLGARDAQFKIQEFAGQAPQGSNRSQFVRDGLLGLLERIESAKPEGSGEQPRH